MTKNMNRIAQTIRPDYPAEIVEILRGNLAPKKMQEALSAYHENDLALALAQLREEERKRLMRILTSEQIAAALEYAEEPEQFFCELSIRQKTEILSFMEASRAAVLLQKLSRGEREALLALLDEETEREIGLIRSFPEDEIGSRMSTNFIVIPDTATVKEAMSVLIRQAAENDNISTLYVIDAAETFCGAIALKDLIIARKETPLAEITTFSYPYLYAKTPIEACVSWLTEYSEESIPVLDDANRLIGVVTAQDFVEILDDALGDDYAKLAGLSSEEDMAESIFQSVRKRLPWLCVLLVLGLGVSAAVGLFEGIVAQLPVILCFQSLILDMAGNVGTQSLAVAIRVLMDTQITPRQKGTLVWKELRVGLCNGCMLGLLSFLCIGLYLCLIGHAAVFSFSVSGCLGIAMILAMVISSLSGTLIPLFFSRLGIDPAVASGPLITTINDLVAVVSYYGLAWLILIQVLHLT